MPDERRHQVKQFEKFDDFTFNGLVYRDLTVLAEIQDLKMHDSGYLLLANYTYQYRDHSCACVEGEEEVDGEGRRLTDLTLEETLGDYAPRSFAAFDEDENAVDVMMFFACWVLEREGGRRPTKRYMKCRGHVSLISLDDAEYARVTSLYCRWMVDHTFTMQSGADIEFVSVSQSTYKFAESDRIAGAVELLMSEARASANHEVDRNAYRSRPGWELFDIWSRSRGSDVVVDLDRRVGGGGGA